MRKQRQQSAIAKSQKLNNYNHAVFTNFINKYNQDTQMEYPANQRKESVNEEMVTSINAAK